MKTMYYCNNECKLIADLGNDAVIELVVGAVEHSGSYDEPPYSDVDQRLLIVTKALLTETKLDLETEFEAAKRRVEKLELEAKARIRQEKLEADKHIKAIKDKVSKYSGLEQMLAFLDGTVKWVVTNTYHGHKIIELSKAVCDYERSSLAAVSFRKKSYHKDEISVKVVMYLEAFVDGSGSSRQEVVGFATQEDAVKYVIEVLGAPGYKVMYYDAETCVQYNIKSPNVDRYLAEQAAATKARRELERKDLEEKLKSFK